jgi:hypothetical protein
VYDNGGFSRSLKRLDRVQDRNGDDWRSMMINYLHQGAMYGFWSAPNANLAAAARYLQRKVWSPWQAWTPVLGVQADWLAPEPPMSPGGVCLDPHGQAQNSHLTVSGRHWVAPGDHSKAFAHRDGRPKVVACLGRVRRGGLELDGEATQRTVRC